jgi:hypothetical protein
MSLAKYRIEGLTQQKIRPEQHDLGQARDGLGGLLVDAAQRPPGPGPPCTGSK